MRGGKTTQRKHQVAAMHRPASPSPPPSPVKGEGVFQPPARAAVGVVADTPSMNRRAPSSDRTDGGVAIRNDRRNLRIGIELVEIHPHLRRCAGGAARAVHAAIVQKVVRLELDGQRSRVLRVVERGGLRHGFAGQRSGRVDLARELGAGQEDAVDRNVVDAQAHPAVVWIVTMREIAIDGKELRTAVHLAAEIRPAVTHGDVHRAQHGRQESVGSPAAVRGVAAAGQRIDHLVDQGQPAIAVDVLPLVGLGGERSAYRVIHIARDVDQVGATPIRHCLDRRPGVCLD